MKIAKADRETFHIFWTTWEISMKFSRKMWLMIILKVIKNQGFILSLEETFFKKPQGGGMGWIWRPPPSRPAVLRLNYFFILLYLLLILPYEWLPVNFSFEIILS